MFTSKKNQLNIDVNNTILQERCRQVSKKGRKAWSLWQPRHLPPAGTYQQQKNSAPGKFAYIAQSEHVNIIALKFQTTRSLFRRRRRRGILNSTQPQNGQSVQFC